jgi:hypothetical protein
MRSGCQQQLSGTDTEQPSREALFAAMIDGLMPFITARCLEIQSDCDGQHKRSRYKPV